MALFPLFEGAQLCVLTTDERHGLAVTGESFRPVELKSESYL
jgi:hypothetical protein